MSGENKVSWDGFKDKASSLIAEARAQGSSILFRGHASSDWELETTLDRSSHDDGVHEYYALILRVKSEIEAYTDRRWDDDPSLPAIQESCGNYDSFSKLFSLSAPPHYSYMSYLRHHGFPSPLLDWTTSPFVAAFFAFRGAYVSERVAIYAYRERDSSGMKLGGSDLPTIRLCGPYISGPKRHFAQRSQYTICTKWGNQPSEPYFYSHNGVCKPFDPKKEFQQDVIYKFELPWDERKRVLRELEDYGLNAYSLFGSEDGLMESLSIRELVR